MRPDFHHMFPLRATHAFHRTPLLSFPKNFPSIDTTHVRPLPRSIRFAPSPPFRSADTIEPIRSALAVSHDLDGLLRTELCRFIAPCYQSWGPPGFRFPSPSSNDQPKPAHFHLQNQTEALFLQCPCHAFPSHRPKTNHQLSHGLKETRLNSFPRLHHPSKFSPRTQLFQSHHLAPCCHEVQCHRLVYPSRRSSVRLSFRFPSNRCQFQICLPSRSPQPTAGG